MTGNSQFNPVAKKVKLLFINGIEMTDIKQLLLIVCQWSKKNKKKLNKKEITITKTCKIAETKKTESRES